MIRCLLLVFVTPVYIVTLVTGVKTVFDICNVLSYPIFLFHTPNFCTTTTIARTHTYFLDTIGLLLCLDMHKVKPSVQNEQSLNFRYYRIHSNVNFIECFFLFGFNYYRSFNTLNNVLIKYIQLKSTFLSIFIPDYYHTLQLLI